MRRAATDDYMIQTAERALRAGIKETSKHFESSSARSADLIAEAGAIFRRQFRRQPAILGEVLGAFLYEAATQLKPDAVLHLKELGAHPDWRDPTGKTALQKVAIDMKGEDAEAMLRTLSGAGAHLDELMEDGKGLTVLHALVQSDDKLGNLEVLLEMQADTNARTENALRETPLHIAVQRQTNAEVTKKIVALLLDNDADPLALNAQRHYPMHVALQNPKFHDWLVPQLLEGYDAIYGKDQINGFLNWAVQLNRDTLIDPLIAVGADVRAQIQGNSIVEWAQGKASEPLLRRIRSLITEAEVAAGMGDGAPETDTVEPSRRSSSMPSPL